MIYTYSFNNYITIPLNYFVVNIKKIFFRTFSRKVHCNVSKPLPLGYRLHPNTSVRLIADVQETPSMLIATTLWETYIIIISTYRSLNICYHVPFNTYFTSKWLEVGIWFSRIIIKKIKKASKRECPTSATIVCVWADGMGWFRG